MKTILKNTMFAAALVAGLSLTSCKETKKAVLPEKLKL
jgi:hypothetical protein